MTGITLLNSQCILLTSLSTHLDIVPEGVLTCKDFLPTRRKLCQRVGYSSYYPDLARLRRTAWPDDISLGQDRGRSNVEVPARPERHGLWL